MFLTDIQFGNVCVRGYRRCVWPQLLTEKEITQGRSNVQRLSRRGEIKQGGPGRDSLFQSRGRGRRDLRRDHVPEALSGWVSNQHVRCILTVGSSRCPFQMYITSTIKTKSSRLAKPVLCLGTLCLAFLTGLNRVSEHRNHCSDVVAGFILGSAIALFLVRTMEGRISRRDLRIIEKSG